MTAVASLGACSAPAKRFEIVKMAPVSPVTPQSEIVLVPPTVGNITVNGEDEQLFASHFKPEEWQRWVALLATARDGFILGVRETKDPLHFAQGDGPRVVFSFEAIQLAKLAPESTGSNPRTVVIGLLRITTPAGGVLEEVRLRARIEAEPDVVEPADIETTRARRFLRAGTELGHRATEYLKTRAGLVN